MRLVIFISAAALAAAFFAQPMAPTVTVDERWLGGCGVEPAAVATIDSDGDGVNDALDKCPFDANDGCNSR